MSGMHPIHVTGESRHVSPESRTPSPSAPDQPTVTG